MDLTLVWVLGFLPLWVLGIVDHHGSRLVALEPLRWPTGGEVARVLECVLVREGPPARILTDRGSVFRAPPVQAALLEAGTKHVMTKPHHPWTNGRMERIFRTFKETLRPCFWIVRSRTQWARLCADFAVFYNDHRPHLAFGGRTPTEVHKGIVVVPAPSRATPTTFFDGRFYWWRFT